MAFNSTFISCNSLITSASDSCACLFTNNSVNGTINWDYLRIATIKTASAILVTNSFMDSPYYRKINIVSKLKIAIDKSFLHCIDLSYLAVRKIQDFMQSINGFINLPSASAQSLDSIEKTYLQYMETPSDGWNAPIIFSYRDFKINPQTKQPTEESIVIFRTRIQQWLSSYELHQQPLIIAEQHGSATSLSVIHYFKMLDNFFEESGIIFIKESLVYNHQPTTELYYWEKLWVVGIEDEAFNNLATAFTCASCYLVSENLKNDPELEITLASTLSECFHILIETELFKDNSLFFHKISQQWISLINEDNQDLLQIIFQMFINYWNKGHDLSVGSDELQEIVQHALKNAALLEGFTELGRLQLQLTAPPAIKRCYEIAEKERCVFIENALKLLIDKIDPDIYSALQFPITINLRNLSWAHNIKKIQLKFPFAKPIILMGSAHVKGFTEEFDKLNDYSTIVN